jgi:hypothetical protein
MPARSIGKMMAPNELPIRRGDDTAELRARYNQLCTALTLNAGTNAAAAERVLQELQTLAQKIAFRESDRAGPAPRAGDAPGAKSDDARPHGKSNVIAFRCRVKGQSRENPRLSAALSALTDDVPLVAVDLSNRPSATVDAAKAGRDRRPSAPESVEPPMVAAVAKQGAELERLVRKSEDQTRALERLEQQLGQGEPRAALSAEVAALRSAATRQGEQLVSLATAVHRLAKLLAAHAPVERR